MIGLKQKRLYSIGQVSKICDVSPRMLRYYEQLGLLTPEKVDASSRYRYYSAPNMQQIQVIRYLIDEGFGMEEIKELLLGDNMDRFRDLFMQKIEKTQNEIEYYHQRLDSLKAWYALFVEGRAAQRFENHDITMKYVPDERYFYYERERKLGEVDSEIYLEIEYFTMSKQNGHTMVDMGGAFHVVYDSYQERMENTYQRMKLLQTMYPNSKSQDNTRNFGGFLALACYHFGSTENIQESYERMLRWAESHRFVLRGDCCERHVLDVYSTGREENYVTELLLPLKEDTTGYELLEKWKQKG